MKGGNNYNRRMEGNKSLMMDYMMEDTSDDMTTFYSSEQIEELCLKATNQNMRIAMFCGGPFSGKRRQGREFARKRNKSCGKPSLCFRIDLPFELEDPGDEPIEKNVIKFALQEMEKHKEFEEDIKVIKDSGFNIVKFCKFFSQKHKDSEFVFVFDDADVVKEQLSGFLDTLKTWTEKCRNVFVILTTQFQYTIYDKCLTHCCEPLAIADAIDFLKDQIKIARETSTNVTIKVPSYVECTKLVELVKCWPFLVMVVAHELKDYLAVEMIELLTKTHLLTLSNEAASNTEQLDSRLQNMVEKLTPALKKSFVLLGDLPDGGKYLTIDDLMKVSKYTSKAEFKQERLVPFQTRSLIERKTTEKLENCKLIDFMDEHVVDNAFDTFQPSAFKNLFNRNIIVLVESSLNDFVRGNKDDFKRCRQLAALQLKEMLNQMKLFDSKEHCEAHVNAECEKVIRAAEDFLKRATRQTDHPVFIREADNAKTKYCFGKKRTISGDSAIDIDENKSDFDENNSGSEMEEASVTPIPIEFFGASGGVSSGASSLKSTVENVGDDPLLLEQLRQDLPKVKDQSHYTQGSQSTALVQDSNHSPYNAQESPNGLGGEDRMVPSGHDSIPPNSNFKFEQEKYIF